MFRLLFHLFHAFHHAQIKRKKLNSRHAVKIAQAPCATCSLLHRDNQNSTTKLCSYLLGMWSLATVPAKCDATKTLYIYVYTLPTHKWFSFIYFTLRFVAMPSFQLHYTLSGINTCMRARGFRSVPCAFSVTSRTKLVDNVVLTVKHLPHTINLWFEKRRISH